MTDEIDAKELREEPMTPKPSGEQNEPSPPMFDDEWDYDESEESRTCEHCDGTGGDPYDDYITPCEHCDGQGYKWWL